MVPTTEDTTAEQTESFNVCLSNPSEDASLGPLDRATVEINDDDGM